MILVGILCSCTKIMPTDHMDGVAQCRRARAGVCIRVSNLGIGHYC